MADESEPLSTIFRGFPLYSGTWSAVSFDEATRQTTLTAASPLPFEAQALVGVFVQPDTSQPWWFQIADNSASVIVLFGDARVDPDGYPFVEAGDAFSLYDLHLAENSPCIDAGSGESTLGVTDPVAYTDIEGVYRSDDPTVSNTGWGPLWVDQGAYEFGDGGDAVCGLPVVHPETGILYYVCEQALDAEAAHAYCQEVVGNHLLYIETEEENGFITAQIDAPVWIGLKEVNDEGEWYWRDEDGRPPFQHWEEGYPTTDFEISCAFMGDSADCQWRDAPCSEIRAFVCESDEPD